MFQYPHIVYYSRHEKNYTSQLLKKFKQVYPCFKDKSWDADLANMKLISKYKKGIHFLLCVIDIFSKYEWIFPLKNKQGMTVINAKNLG